MKLDGSFLFQYRSFLEKQSGIVFLSKVVAYEKANLIKSDVQKVIEDARERGFNILRNSNPAKVKDYAKMLYSKYNPLNGVGRQDCFIICKEYPAVYGRL